MVRFIIALLILIIAVTVGYFISTFPALVLIHLPEYTFKVNLIVWLLISLVAAIVIIYLFKFLLFIWHSPTIFSRNIKDRKARKSDKLLRKGLAELISGHYAKAEKHLAKGAKISDELEKNSVIFYENAAIAATNQQALDRRDKYLLKARQKSDSNQRHLTYLSEAEMYVANKDYQAAQPLLEQIYKKEPTNTKVLQLLDQTYVAQTDWQNAWRLLPRIKSQLGQNAYDERKKTYAKGLLHDTPEIETYSQLADAWKKIPKDVKQDPEMIIEFASSLVENGHAEDAVRLLESEIKRHDNLSLVQAYSQLEDVDSKSQLKFLEKLSSKYQNEPLFHYAYALVAYKSKEYQVAAKQIETSLHIRQTPEAFALWGQILEAQNQPQAALAAYRQSIHRIELDEPLQGDLLLSHSSVDHDTKEE